MNATNSFVRTRNTPLSSLQGRDTFDLLILIIMFFTYHLGTAVWRLLMLPMRIVIRTGTRFPYQVFVTWLGASWFVSSLFERIYFRATTALVQVRDVLARGETFGGNFERAKSNKQSILIEFFVRYNEQHAIYTIKFRVIIDVRFRILLLSRNNSSASTIL